MINRAGRREFNHVRYFFSQIEKYKKAMNNEQMGRLFFAIYEYAKTGKKAEVGGDIIYPYDEACYNLDKARARFDEDDTE